MRYQNEFILWSVKIMKICLFGSYYPHFERSATITSAMSYLMTLVNNNVSVCVFGNKDSLLPPCIDPIRVNLKKSWAEDDLISLFKTFINILLERDCDLYVFNIYLTSFGKHRLTNFLGLLMPIWVSFLPKRRVLTYMHNFLETQDIGKLGYKAGLLTKLLVRFVERLLATFTELVTTLPSMASEMETILKTKVSSTLILYADATISFVSNKEKIVKSLSHKRSNPRLLLFGSWGPQKDIMRVLELLSRTVYSNDLQILVAGSINKSFPSYYSLVSHFVSELNDERFKFVWNPPEEEIPFLFLESDAIILPYLASGGASGVMQLASFYSLEVIAYHNTQLEELASLIDEKVTFIDPDDGDSLKHAISKIKVKKDFDIVYLENKLNHAVESISRLLRVME